MELFTKKSNVWSLVEASVKDGTFNITKPFVFSEEAWKGKEEGNILLVSVSVDSANTLTFQRNGNIGTEMTNSPSYYANPLKTTKIENGVRTVLNDTGVNIIDLPAGAYDLEFLLPEKASLSLFTNMFVTEIKDMSRYTGFCYPVTTSSKLVKVPDVLPQTIKTLEFGFNFCSAFNQNLNGWDFSNIKSVRKMFSNCMMYNQEINFNTLSCVNASGFLEGCMFFNSPVFIEAGKVTDFSWFVHNCMGFNQPISLDTSNGVNFDSMFAACSNFNQPVIIDTSNGQTFRGMFGSSPQFNQSLSHFVMSNATNVYQMFRNASRFSQDISSWDVTKVTDWTNFSSGSGLTTAKLPAKFRV